MGKQSDKGQAESQARLTEMLRQLQVATDASVQASAGGPITQGVTQGLAIRRQREAMNEAPMPEQLAGPGSASYEPGPEQLSGPGMDELMGRAVMGSGRFSQADIKRGYKKL